MVGLIVNQQGDHLVVDVLGIVPLSAGIHVGYALALGSHDSHFNGLIADLVGILSDGAVEPTVANRVLLSSARIEASNDYIAVLAALGEILTVGYSGQEAGNGALVGAEDSDGLLAQQGVCGSLNRGGLGSGGYRNLDDDSGIGDLLLPLCMALYGCLLYTSPSPRD